MSTDIRPIPRLPEPDWWLIGGLEDDERAEGHDRWHVEHPGDLCDQPDRPRSAHRPGRWERFRREMR